MTNHLPECYERELIGLDCICDRLRACEQRVREEWYEVQSETWVRGFDVGVRAAREERMKEDDDYAYVSAQAEADGRRRGWVEALDAARDAVAAIGDDCNCYEDLGIRADALAAIDALREQPADQTGYNLPDAR